MEIFQCVDALLSTKSRPTPSQKIFTPELLRSQPNSCIAARENIFYSGHAARRLNLEEDEKMDSFLPNPSEDFLPRNGSIDFQFPECRQEGEKINYLGGNTCKIKRPPMLNMDLISEYSNVPLISPLSHNDILVPLPKPIYSPVYSKEELSVKSITQWFPQEEELHSPSIHLQLASTPTLLKSLNSLHSSN